MERSHIAIVVGLAVASLGAGALWAGLGSGASSLAVGGATFAILGLATALWGVDAAGRERWLAQSVMWKERDQDYRRSMGSAMKEARRILSDFRRLRHVPDGPSLDVLLGSATWPDDPWPNRHITRFLQAAFSGHWSSRGTALLDRANPAKEIVELWGHVLANSKGADARALREMLVALSGNHGSTFKFLWYLVKAHAESQTQMPLPPAYTDFELVRAAFYPGKVFSRAVHISQLLRDD